MQQTDILCTTNQRPVSSDGGITDDSVCLCAVKWRRLLSSLIHWYWEREIIIYYFPNSLKDDVWASVHTCGRAAAGWSQMRQRALRRAGGEKISHHANDLQLAGFTSGDREVLQSHRAEAQQATLTITASCVNTVVDAWRSRARDRPPHHINIQLCLQEMIDSQQQQQNTVKTNSSVNLSAEIFTQYHPAVTNAHWSLFHPCSGGKSKV